MPNYQQPNYQQPNSGDNNNYQQPNYQQPNYQQPNYGGNNNYRQPNNNYGSSNTNTSTSKNTNSSNNTNNMNKNFSDNASLDPYTKLEKIKNKGNDFFREKRYSEANDKYYEVLNEIDYFDEKDLKTYKKEINSLELTTRLNLANSRLKLGEYNLAVHECIKVLKSGDNFKAHYRAGLGYYNLKNYEQSIYHFT